MLLQFLINGFITGLMYALTAIAFSLTYNTTRIFHIAYAGIIVAASYFMLFFLKLGLPWVFAIFLTLVATGALNLMVEKGVYQPMEKRKNSHNTIMVASIGVFIVLINLAALLFGNENQTFSQSLSQSFSAGNLIITRMQFWQLIIAGSCIAMLLLIISLTKLGLNIRALSGDQELFTVFGNNAQRLRLMLFFVSGVCAAVVSLLLSHDVGFDPYFGMPLLLNALVAMIIGGIGSFKGSLVGGILLGVVQSVAVYLFEARWETAITFIIFLIILLMRPQGFFGIKQRLV